MPNGTRVKTDRGTPQGGPLSPLLSNIVLDELDQELSRRGLRFVRYADDFNIYVTSERAGRRVMESVTRFIEKRLRLEVNHEKSSVGPSEEVHFLGFSLQKQVEGDVRVMLSQRTRDRLDVRIRELTPRNWGSSVEDCFAAVNLTGWIGYFQLCTRAGARVLRRYDAHIRRRIRAIIVKQRKRPKHLFRHLVERGASRKTAAKTAWSSCGPWRKSNLPGMTVAYRNAWFHADRLVSLWTSWEKWHPPEPASTASGQLLLAGL